MELQMLHNHSHQMAADSHGSMKMDMQSLVHGGKELHLPLVLLGRSADTCGKIHFLR